MMTNDLLTPLQISGFLNCRRARTYEMIKSGLIPSVRIGGRYFVPRLAWETWLDQQTATALAKVGLDKACSGKIAEAFPHE